MTYSDEICKIANYVYKAIPWLDIEDVLSETYIAMLEHKTKKLSCRQRLALQRDVIDVFISRKWRHSYRGRFEHRYYGIQCPDASVPESPEDAYIERIEIEQLMAAMSDAERVLLTDHYWHGLTFAAMAESEGVTPSMISKRHKHILEAMRS